MYKCLLCVDFILDGRGHQGRARLEIELPFCPSKEIEFEHPVWHEPKAPTSISYNLENRAFTVCLPQVILHSAEDVSAQKEIYSEGGWTVS